MIFLYWKTGNTVGFSLWFAGAREVASNSNFHPVWCNDKMVNLQEWEHTGLCAICQGRKQFPVETEGLCSPSKVSRSICCLWLHHNCINKDSSSRGVKAAISSSIRGFIPASAVLPCKQRGSAGIYWCHSLPLNEQLLPCFHHPANLSTAGNGLWGC